MLCHDCEMDDCKPDESSKSFCFYCSYRPRNEILIPVKENVFKEAALSVARDKQKLLEKLHGKDRKG